ncbi:MAG: hypothetical protein WA765_04005 [Candidatus Acidiferrum sp.]
MTIALSVKINDGVVLAADSASTVMGATPQGLSVINVYDNANKAFNLLKGYPIGAVTWGAGGIGNASISSLVKDFRKRLKDDPEGLNSYKLNTEQYTVEEVAIRLRRFIYEENYVGAFANLPPAQKPPLGFIVAGYGRAANQNGPHADEYSVVIDQGNCGPPNQLRRSEDSGIFWAGMGESLHRLILGYGAALPAVLQQNLGVPVEQVTAAMEVIKQALGSQLAISAMPLKDAIDLAEFLADVAVKYSKFSPGANSVGGPIEIAAISKHEGFKWVTRKFYFDRSLTPNEDN